MLGGEEARCETHASTPSLQSIVTLRGRMTVMGKDPVGEGKGIVIAQHDLLDEAGRLVFSCLTRSIFAR